MKIFKIAMLLVLVAVASSFAAKPLPSVKIGKQIWMKRNMNVKTEHSWCYDNMPENCRKYGRLYTWNDAMKVCPTGWHLPTLEDFYTLQEYHSENYPDFSKKIRSKEWKTPAGGNGTDDYGLAVFPAGFRHKIYETFHNLGSNTYWWSATEKDKNNAYYLDICGAVVLTNVSYKESGFSVRCIKDND